MTPYTHIVQYYETDKMGITHHSNYIRWMEEARVDFLKQIGWSYKELEDEGIISAVTAIDGKYKVSTTFSDEIKITTSITEVKGAVLKLDYSMTNQQGKTVFQGHSEHCFLNSNNRLVRLRKEHPAFFEALETLVSKQ